MSSPDDPHFLRADNLTIIGWGELYRTGDDAKDHRFDSLRERALPEPQC